MWHVWSKQPRLVEAVGFFRTELVLCLSVRLVEVHKMQGPLPGIYRRLGVCVCVSARGKPAACPGCRWNVACHTARPMLITTGDQHVRRVCS